jgi:hypothetical protein
VLQNNASVRVVHRESGFDFGECRTRTGGAKTGENAKIRPGGMAPAEAFPGAPDYDDVEVTRLLRLGKDSGLVQKANDMYGERVDVTHQPTDAKGRTGFHRPVIYTGLINSVNGSEYDADSSDAAVLTLGVTIDGVV